MSPAAFTRGQNVSLSTSVTCPTAGTAVSKLDLAARLALPEPPPAAPPSCPHPVDLRWGQFRDRLSEEGEGLQQGEEVGRIEGEEKGIRSAIWIPKIREREKWKRGGFWHEHQTAGAEPE